MSWWRGAVLYHVYVRSFADSNGDGIGDLPGLLGRLDHLVRLGVDGIWLSPTMPSPNADWGYDVSDYCAVHPELGTLADLDRLIAEAGRRGIRVLLDLVPNHTSDRHDWFAESRASRDSAKREWYIWADRPNNWLASFGGPAWTLDERTGQYYLHNFLPEQPDLNWWSDEVREAFDGILRFWFERGIVGFRIDVAHGIVKDRRLRDNPPALPNDPPQVRAHGQRSVYSANRPEVHEVLGRWRRLAEEYEPARLLLGETYVFEAARLADFYGELRLALNVPFLFAPLEADALARVVEETGRLLGPDACPLWCGSSHDAVRFPTRWCEGDPARVRCALVALLTLPGTALLYYGDEIGMPQVDVPRGRARDSAGGRDGSRTPMQWSPEAGAGFTEPGVEPWLPLGDARACNVAEQDGDADSTLTLCRDLIALRRGLTGPYERLPAPPGVWRYRRGPDAEVVLNLSARPARVETQGTIRLATGRGREGEQASVLALEPWEAVVL